MSRIETLRRNYQRVCGMPWDRHVSGPQRVWVAVHDKEDDLTGVLGHFRHPIRTADRRGRPGYQSWDEIGDAAACIVG